jgi:tetratricopeptide (TPR) repeat protein
MNKEVPIFLERRKKGELKIFMLMLSHCAWEEVEWTNNIVGFPLDNQPLETMSESDQNKVMVDFMRKIKQEFDSQAQAISHSEENSLKKPFNVPFESKRDGAIGIEEKFLEVDKILRETKKTAIGQVATFEGMGGLGKTQLVVEYAHRYRDSFDGVVWLTVDQNIDEQITNLAEDTGWVQKNIDEKIKIEISYNKFRALENTLLIYDNVENYKEIEPYIPKATNNFMLITSRNIIKGFPSVPLSVLSEEYSLKLLEAESDRAIGDSEMASAKKLVQELDGLPLALEMAGAFVREFELTWDDYLENFLEDGVEFLDEGEIVGWTKHESNISKTLNLSEAFLQENPLLGEILALIAWGASEPMDKELISKILAVTPAKLSIALNKGVKLRLIKVEDENKEKPLYTLHRLVKEVWTKQKQLDKNFTEKVSANLASFMKEIKDEFLNFDKIERASHQAKVWAQKVEDAETKALLLTYAVYPEYYMGEYQKALKNVEVAYDIVKDTNYSDTHAEILTSKGTLLEYLGDAIKALPYYKEALEMQKALYPNQNHPDVASSLNNMGSVLNSLGDAKKALPYYEKALEMRKALYPNQNHPDVASSLNNMGYVLNSLGDAKKALPYFKEALEMQKALYPNQNHPDVANSLNNVGSILLKFKKCNQAKKYLEEAKSMMEALGYDSGKIIIINNHLKNVARAIKKEQNANFKKKGRYCVDTPVM